MELLSLLWSWSGLVLVWSCIVFYAVDISSSSEMLGSLPGASLNVSSLLCGLVLVVSGFWDIMGTSASWCGSGWGPGRDPRGCYWPQTLSAKCHTGVLWSGDYSSSDSLISIRPTQLRHSLEENFLESFFFPESRAEI